MDCLKRIRELLDQRGWSMYQLSVKSGVAQSTLSNLFIRYNSPSVATLEKICKAFNISMSEFFEQESPVQSLDDKLLKLWHGLSDEKKEALLSLISPENSTFKEP